MSSFTAYLSSFQNPDAILRVGALMGTAGLFGSSFWASYAVMPSLLSSQLPPNKKSHIANQIVIYANRAVLALVGVTSTALGVLYYRNRRVSDLVGFTAVIGGLGAQVFMSAGPRKELHKISTKGESNDSGKEADEKIKIVAALDVVKTVCFGLACFIGIYDVVRDGVITGLRSSAAKGSGRIIGERPFDRQQSSNIVGYPTARPAH
ncbi:hypothetical protein SAICODRAFT_30595 [Saitoella complicata NRRL Y-17804]|nr:uncharacterized protein SAICODRAFT_30595 [Saitoella complicata NRRL Y-17804]ODQ52820.1 hypothetical protein SAICODRAFT_30595 [Saitoella complicata NRRL Y-17804]